MGVVYRARQHGLDRLVALKMILGTGADHETAQRFLQEARAGHADGEAAAHRDCPAK